MEKKKSSLTGHTTDHFLNPQQRSNVFFSLGATEGILNLSLMLFLFFFYSHNTHTNTQLTLNAVKSPLVH